MDLNAKLKCQAQVFQERGERLLEETEHLDERFIALGVITGDYLEELTDVVRRGYPTGDIQALLQAYADLQSLATQNLQALLVLCKNMGFEVVQVGFGDGGDEGGDSADGENGNGGTVRRDSE
jgi:hypothetical protein